MRRTERRNRLMSALENDDQTIVTDDVHTAPDEPTPILRAAVGAKSAPEDSGDRIFEFDPAVLTVWEHHDRKALVGISALAAKIAAEKQQQPGLVRKRDDGTYEVVFGVRRMHACLTAGIKFLARITTKTDEELFFIMKAENSERDDLSIYETATSLINAINSGVTTVERLVARGGVGESTLVKYQRFLTVQDIPGLWRSLEPYAAGLVLRKTLVFLSEISAYKQAEGVSDKEFAEAAATIAQDVEDYAKLTEKQERSKLEADKVGNQDGGDSDAAFESANEKKVLTAIASAILERYKISIKEGIRFLRGDEGTASQGKMAAAERAKSIRQTIRVGTGSAGYADISFDGSSIALKIDRVRARTEKEFDEIVKALREAFFE